MNKKTAAFAAVLAGGVAWFGLRGGGPVDRGLMAEDSRAAAVLIPNYELISLRPGDRVDLLVVFSATWRDGPKKYAATLIQNAKVLGAQRSAKFDGKGAVYLMLNPAEAQYAALGASLGEVSIVLRRRGDREIHPLEMVDFSKLFL